LAQDKQGIYNNLQKTILRLRQAKHTTTKVTAKQQQPRVYKQK